MWLLIIVVIVVDFFAIRHILGKDKKKRPDPAPEEYLHRDEEELPPLNLAATDVFKRNTNPRSVLDRMPVSSPLVDNSWILKDCTYIDTETTGLHPGEDKIVEIAAVRVRNNQVVDSFQRLVDPLKHIPAAASRINGITNDMVSGKPTFENVVMDFLEFIGDDILVGYNVSFDTSFIEREMHESLSNSTYDVYRMARDCLTSSNYKLKTLCVGLGISETQDHRGQSDAVLTFRLVQKIKELTARNGIRLDMSLLRVSDGKYYSITLKDIVPRKDPDPGSFFYKKHVVFTGTLPIPRIMAMQAVVDQGGSVGNTILKRTRFLVQGKNAGSVKVEKAKASKEAGQDIAIMTAEEFVEEIGRG